MTSQWSATELGKLRPRDGVTHWSGVSGETCSLQAQGGATEHPGQVQEVDLFAPVLCPDALHLGVGGAGDVLVRTEGPGERAQLHGESAQGLLGGCGGQGLFLCPEEGAGLGCEWGRVMLPWAPTGLHVPQIQATGAT